ncbi:MAG: cytochrome c biogenesis protein CcsA [Coriobacteriales bacterium]|jgi:cytochrome c-type biogenesis protein CcmF|nr:cytochrome c biogenesis protein CcsA [Coriobacteriales bacterium]
MIVMLGFFSLLFAFVGVVVSTACLLAGHLSSANPKSTKAVSLIRAGHIAALSTAVLLTVCCLVLVFCFFAGDTTITYVVKNQSSITGSDAWLYKLSGLWGGREGSLLFWAWLISVFNALVVVRNFKAPKKIDTMALFVAQVVLTAFVGVLLFSGTNMPFVPMAPEHFDADGKLTGVAALWGMNPLLEHWAMAIHPPTLFVGYAGLTIPFAYAIAALIINDPSKVWVERATRYALFSWLLLGIGIGLGSVWAYVVLGWGGYWGWDPVENASLLSWLVGLALIHSFTIYRKRGVFKRWAIMCACLTFAFVVVGTFITRSGIVQSVHAFEGDTVSLLLFLFLILASVAAGVIGLLIRWDNFGPSEDEGDNFESLTSRAAAYYLNNVILIVISFLLLYLTVSSALPKLLPFGGDAIPPSMFNTIAWPLGILYSLLIVLAPLLSWAKTEGKVFLQRAWLPAVGALVMFVLLLIYFMAKLLPAYKATLAAGGETASALLNYGPFWYYNGLAILGFLVASLLLFTSLFMLGRRIKIGGAALLSRLGGPLAHAAMAIILVGLIGSSMYVTEKTDHFNYDSDADTASKDLVIQDYTLRYTGENRVEMDDGASLLYGPELDVYKNNKLVGHINPTALYSMETQMQKFNAGVLSFWNEDLFVVYRGVDSSGGEAISFVFDLRVNPLISWVWIGFVLMMIGITLSVIGRRSFGTGRTAGLGAKDKESLVPGGIASDTSGEPSKPVSAEKSSATKKLGSAEKSGAAKKLATAKKPAATKAATVKAPVAAKTTTAKKPAAATKKSATTKATTVKKPAGTKKEK